MDGAKFKETIDYYGEKNILGVLFDNSSVKLFSENEFSLENCYNENLEALQFVEHDVKGHPFHVIKDVENIQGVVVRDNGMKFSDYDRVSLRG